MFEQSQVTTYSATLLGAKQFKGEIDGNKIDSCTELWMTKSILKWSCELETFFLTNCQNV